MGRGPQRRLPALALSFGAAFIAQACAGRSLERHESSAEHAGEGGTRADAGAPSNGGSRVSRGGSPNGGTSGTRGGTSGSSGTAASGASGRGGEGGESGTAGEAGAGGVGTKRGACLSRFAGTVDATTTFSGVLSYVVVSEEGVNAGNLDDLVCAIRFDVERIGEAPPGCAEYDAVLCSWSHLVRLTNPVVTLDVDGACANNEMGFDAAWMMAMDGSEVAYGYLDNYAAHTSILMRFDGSGWQAAAPAYWDPTTGDFSFQEHFGACRY